MPDAPKFLVVPPLRCGAPREDSPRSFCGERAVYERPDPDFTPVRFYCGKHHQDGDTPIAADVLFRRLTLTLDVLFAGVTLTDELARAEAYDRLAHAVEDLGGVISLHRITSEVGRYSPPVGEGRGRGIRGKG